MLAPFTLFAIYFVVWWLCLFVVLPFRVRTQADAGEVIHGTEAGAPVVFRFWRLMLWTSLLAIPVTLLFLWAVSNTTLQQYWN